MTIPASDALRVAEEVATAFANLPHVTAVALGGSLASDAADDASDIDLYVYSTEPVSLVWRSHLATRRGIRVEVGNHFWEPGDEWDEAGTGLHVDIMYRTPDWIERELACVLDEHRAKLGYTTCLWHNVLTSRPMLDPDGWFVGMRARIERPYPEELVSAIVARNHPVLRSIAGSYRAQILKAAGRSDGVSLNHRTAAFLASYFDILFAMNRTPHPGEKRLLRAASDLPLTPPNLLSHVETLLRLSVTPKPYKDLDRVIDSLCNELDACLACQQSSQSNQIVHDERARS